jgi:hypothetical protein
LLMQILRRRRRRRRRSSSSSWLSLCRRLGQQKSRKVNRLEVIRRLSLHFAMKVESSKHRVQRELSFGLEMIMENQDMLNEKTISIGDVQSDRIHFENRRGAWHKYRFPKPFFAKCH